MNNNVEYKVNIVQRQLYAYATFLIIGLLWSMMDGEIESPRQFVRGLVRSIVMIYLAKDIWSLKKMNWWIITIASITFGLFGILAIAISIIGGIAFDIKILKIAVIALPATLILIKCVINILDKDVRREFVN